jgi:hypothetical protein
MHQDIEAARIGKDLQSRGWLKALILSFDEHLIYVNSSILATRLHFVR